MGKRKIGEIYNRPIIEGDINLKTPSEIHKSELGVPQSGGSGDAPSQPSGENSWAYLKYTGPVPSFWPPELLMLLHVVKYSYGDAVYIEPLALQQKINQTEEVKGYAINLDMKVNSYYTDYSLTLKKE